MKDVPRRRQPQGLYVGKHGLIMARQTIETVLCAILVTAELRLDLFRRRPASDQAPRRCHGY
jgi:hypothetical protein